MANSKLVSKEMLALLVQKLDERMKAGDAAGAAALATEIEKVQDQIDALVGDGEGSVVEQINAAKEELQGNIDGVAQDLADFEAEQAEKEADQDKALEDAVKEIEDAMADEADRVDKKIADDIAAESALRVAEEARIEGKVDKFIGETYVADQATQAQKDADQDKALTDTAAAIRGEMATEAQRVDAKIADDIKAATDAQGLVNDDFEARIAANEAFVAAQPAIDEAQDEKIAALEAKFDGEDSVDAKIEAAQKAAEDKAAELDAALKAELQKEIDDDVQVVADELAKQMDATQAGTLAKQIADEKARMDAFMLDADMKESAIDTLLELQNYIDEHGEAAAKMVEDIAANAKAIEDEAKRADEEEKAIRADFAEEIGTYSVAADPENGVEAVVASGLKATIEARDAATLAAANKYADEKVAGANDLTTELENAFVAFQESANAADERIEGKADDNAAEIAKQKDADQDGTLANQIKVEKARAEEQEGLIRKEMAAAIGNYSSGEGEEAVAASGLRKEIEDAHKAMNEEAADIRADFAQADTELHNTVKEEMASIVSSLSVKFENDKLVVGLGNGVDFVTLNEQPVEMVTEQDIMDMIAALDEEEEGQE